MIRTPDLLIRSQSLYPAELRARPVRDAHANKGFWRNQIGWIVPSPTVWLLERTDLLNEVRLTAGFTLSRHELECAGDQ